MEEIGGGSWEDVQTTLKLLDPKAFCKGKIGELASSWAFLCNKNNWAGRESYHSQVVCFVLTYLPYYYYIIFPICVMEAEFELPAQLLSQPVFVRQSHKNILKSSFCTGVF